MNSLTLKPYTVLGTARGGYSSMSILSNSGRGSGLSSNTVKYPSSNLGPFRAGLSNSRGAT